VSLSTRIAVIVADLITLAVTWYKAAWTVREAHRLGISAPMGETLLRDGQWSAINGRLLIGANDIMTDCPHVEMLGTLFFL
jgi:hypothetical protein